MTEIKHEWIETLRTLFENKEPAQKITWAFRRFKDQVFQVYPELKVLSPLEAAYWLVYEDELPKCQICGNTLRYKTGEGFVCTNCENENQEKVEVQDSIGTKDKIVVQVQEKDPLTYDTPPEIIIENEDGMTEETEAVEAVEEIAEAIEEEKSATYATDEQEDKMTDVYKQDDLIEKQPIDKSDKSESNKDDQYFADEFQSVGKVVGGLEDAEDKEVQEYCLTDSLETFFEAISEFGDPIYFSKVRTDDGTPLYILESSGYVFMFRSSYSDLDFEKAFRVICNNLEIDPNDYELVCGITPVWVLDSFNLHPFLDKLDFIEKAGAGVRK